MQLFPLKPEHKKHGINGLAAGRHGQTHGCQRESKCSSVLIIFPETELKNKHFYLHTIPDSF